MKIETAELRTCPNCVQVEGEEGRYDTTRGYAIEARVVVPAGDAIYTYQQTFPTEEAAELRVARFGGKIDTDAPAWELTGTNY